MIQGDVYQTDKRRLGWCLTLALWGWRQKDCRELEARVKTLRHLVSQTERRTGEMTQWLRALVTGNLGLAPSTQMAAHNHVTPPSGGSDYYFF